MDIDTIERLAEESGLDLYKRGLKMVIAGGLAKFESRHELTITGERMIKFANAVEDYALSKTDQKATG